MTTTRIVEITYAWPAETFICRHVEALAQVAGMDVILATKSPAPPNSASAQRSSCGISQVTFLPNFDHATLPTKIRFAFSSREYTRRAAGRRSVRDAAMLWAIDKLEPDIVHFHFGTLATLLYEIPRRLGIPYTLSLRGSDIQVWPLTHPEEMDTFQQALLGASGIHTVCDEFGQYASNQASGCVPPTTIRTTVPLPEVRDLWGDGKNPPQFVSVGRLHWRKAFDDLIRTMAKLPDASLIIVGDGPEKEHLLYLIKALQLEERVRLVGSLPFNDFKDLLRQSTAYVQSSIAEGFSNALAEAMALGMPVFTTPAGGTAEIIVHEHNGLLMPAGDPARMAEVLQRACDRHLLSSLGHQARLTAEAQFSAEKHAREFESFFRAASNRYSGTV